MIPWLDDEATEFPPAEEALGRDTDAPGLLAAGRRLDTALLEQAYRCGIFPWFSPGQPVLWWSPDPRMVLQVQDFKLSRSLRKTLRRFMLDPGCEIRVDHAFERVIRHCAQTRRAGQQGTWITPRMIRTYVEWHRQGRAHSFETWIDGELVGGLYGISIGRMFFGESMFAHRTDASKVALSALVAFCRAHRVPWIDCQQNTGHLASLGAAEVPRPAFVEHLNRVVEQPGIGLWSYDESLWSQLGMVDAGDPRANDRDEDSHP